jgi:hypothetical protein
LPVLLPPCPDSSCCRPLAALPPSCHRSLRVFDLPQGWVVPELEQRHDSEVVQQQQGGHRCGDGAGTWPCGLLVQAGEMVYDYTWFVGMSANDPASCCFASTCRVCCRLLLARDQLLAALRHHMSLQRHCTTLPHLSPPVPLQDLRPAILSHTSHAARCTRLSCHIHRANPSRCGTQSAAHSGLCTGVMTTWMTPLLRQAWHSAWMVHTL